MSVYLDASVLVPMHVREPKTDAVDRFIEDETRPLVISSYAAGEFASVMSRYVRSEMLTSDDARSRLIQFDIWTGGNAVSRNVEATDILHAAQLVRRFELKIRMPDAIHAAICMRDNLTLVTLDVRLADAARTLEVAVAIPS